MMSVDDTTSQGNMPMATSQDRHIRNYYNNLDTMSLQKLGEIISELYLASDDRKKSDQLWTKATAALDKLDADKARVAKVVSSRNIEDLARMLGDLTLQSQTGKPAAVPAPAKPAPVQPAAAAPAADATPPDAIDSGTLKAAMKSFRKRLKLTSLDHESSLGRSPLTGGRKAGIVAIQPPDRFPKEVWRELARQGRLKDAGRGFYELND
jgi:hypothetical protein